MSKRSTHHATFVIERDYPFPPARVFAAWADPKAKTRWFRGPEEWEKSEHKLDFRVGGCESFNGGPAGGTKHFYSAIYQDIVPGERIVLSYDMHLDKTRIPVSLLTVEFFPEGKNTKLILTEQDVFLDAFEDPGARGREGGTRDLLDNLGRELQS